MWQQCYLAVALQPALPREGQVRCTAVALRGLGHFGQICCRPWAPGGAGPACPVGAAPLVRVACVLCVYPFALVGVLGVPQTLRTNTAQRNNGGRRVAHNKDRATRKGFNDQP